MSKATEREWQPVVRTPRSLPCEGGPLNGLNLTTVGDVVVIEGEPGEYRTYGFGPFRRLVWHEDDDE